MIYPGVTVLKYVDTANMTASSSTTLGLFGVHAAVGSLMLFGSDELRAKIRPVHRITAYTLAAAGIWLSVSMATDEGTTGTTANYVSYGYNALTVFPILLFMF